MRMFLSRFRDEFDVITADCGETAIQELKETQIDLLITDLVMPGIDGLSLLAHINEHYPRTLCIAMTGYATDNVIRMLPNNLLYFMRKPLNLNELADIIRKSLKGKPPTGTVGGITIASFLKLIEMDEKSCALEVSFPEGGKGVFLFREGVLYDAAFEELIGEAAAVAMISRDERVIFTLHPLPKQDTPRRINSRMMELLLTASCRQDKTAPATHRNSSNHHFLKGAMVSMG